MASVKFIEKKPAGGAGNFEYKYECTCSSGKKHNVSVTTGNDNQAKQLAEMECNEKCNEN